MEKQHENNPNGNGGRPNRSYVRKPEFEVRCYVSKDGKGFIHEVIERTYHPVPYVEAIFTNAKKPKGTSPDALPAAKAAA